eukprot:gene6536-6288_t
MVVAPTLSTWGPISWVGPGFVRVAGRRLRLVADGLRLGPLLISAALARLGCPASARRCSPLK